MLEYLNKGISTSFAITVILLIALIVGALTVWQNLDMQREELEVTEVKSPEKEYEDIITIVPGKIVENNGKDTIVVEGTKGGEEGEPITASIKVDQETLILFYQKCEWQDELYATRRVGSFPELTEELLERLSSDEDYVMIRVKELAPKEYRALVIIEGHPPASGCGF